MTTTKKAAAKTKTKSTRAKNNSAVPEKKSRAAHTHPGKYSDEFKQEVLHFYASHPEISKVQLCKDFGISEPTIYAWVGKSKQKQFDDLETVSIEEYRKAIKRQKQLEQELIIMKKAAAYFASEVLPSPK
jgi:transposase